MRLGSLPPGTVVFCTVQNILFIGVLLQYVGDRPVVIVSYFPEDPTAQHLLGDGYMIYRGGWYYPDNDRLVSYEEFKKVQSEISV